MIMVKMFLVVFSILFTVATIKASVWVGIMVLTGLSIYGLIKYSK